MDVGMRIRELRESRGWTTNRLANQCGLSQSFLRSVELGEKGISVDNLALICETLQISLADFFTHMEGGCNSKDALLQELQRLNAKQRRALAAFLRELW